MQAESVLSGSAVSRRLALVIGAGGGLGTALVQVLSKSGDYGIDSVLALRTLGLHAYLIPRP